MAGFSIELFKGIRPRISAKKLPIGEAQIAENLRLGSGSLEPFLAQSAGTPVAETWYNKTIYRYEFDTSTFWLQWDDYVDVALGPVKDDSLARVYFTGDGVPKMTTKELVSGGGTGPWPEGDRDLGIPSPPQALSAGSSFLPENVPSSERLMSGLTCDAFMVDTVAFTTYPGTGTDNQTWRRATTPTGQGTIRFRMEPEDHYKVTRVISATKVALQSASTPGIFVRTKSASSVPADTDTADQYWISSDEQGSTKVAKFVGWAIPEVIVSVGSGGVTQHGLSVGDVIKTTSVGGDGTSPLTFEAITTIDMYEQSWGTETIAADGTYQLNNARIAPAVAEGTSTFSIVGSFRYEVVRGASDSALVEDRQYVYTYVSDLGEEGPPSPVSNVVEVIDGKTVTVEGLDDIAANEELDNRSISFFRLYRTNSSEAGTEFQFVREVPVGPTSNPTTSINDNIASAYLGEVIETTTWLVPDPDMIGITEMPNGMLAGFKGKTVYFCEPYFPHAWPPEYDQAVEYPIVGLASIGNSLVVLTEGHPYTLTGSHPRNVNLRDYKLKLSCKNKESIATGRNAVFYAAPEGLVRIDAGGAQLVTKYFIESDDWLLYEPSNMVGEFYRGKYIGFFGGEAAVPQPPTAAVITGTFVSAPPTEQDIRDGGKTIIITLTGTHTFEDAGAAFNATRQDIIDAFVSNKDATAGWNAVLANFGVTEVVRTTANIVTWTLPAHPTYFIDAGEILEATFIPAVFKATVPTDDIIADNTLAVSIAGDFSSELMYVTLSATFGYSDGDSNDFRQGSFSDTTVAVSSVPNTVQVVVYDNTALKFLIGANDSDSFFNNPVLYSSVDGGLSWAPNRVLDSITGGFMPEQMFYAADYDTHILTFINTLGPALPVQYFSEDNGASWQSFEADAPNGWDAISGAIDIVAGNMYAPMKDESGSNLRIGKGSAVFPENNWEAIEAVLDSETTGVHDSVATGNNKVLYCKRATDTDCEIGWLDRLSEVDTAIGSLVFSTSVHFMLVYGNGIFMVMNDIFALSTVTADGSETTFGNWATVTTPGPANVTVHNLYYDPGDGVTAGWGWVACGVNTSSSKGVIYVSSDDGANWTLAHTTTQNDTIISCAFTNYINNFEKQ